MRKECINVHYKAGRYKHIYFIDNQGDAEKWGKNHAEQYLREIYFWIGVFLSFDLLFNRSTLEFWAFKSYVAIRDSEIIATYKGQSGEATARRISEKIRKYFNSIKDTVK